MQMETASSKLSEINDLPSPLLQKDDYLITLVLILKAKEMLAINNAPVSTPLIYKFKIVATF